MKKLSNIALLLCFIVILLNGTNIFSLSTQALSIWFEKLVPSMFVTMVFIRLLYQRNALRYLRFLVPCKLLRMDAACADIILSTMFLGFPAGAAFLDEQCANGVIDEAGAKRLIPTCCFATSGFVIMTCGVVLFHSITIGFLLFLSQILSGLVLLWFDHSTWIHIYQAPNQTTQPFMKQLFQSIVQTGTSLYMIGGYLLLFMSISYVFVKLLPETIQLPLRILSEFSSGVVLIQDFIYPSFIKMILTCMLLGFGGICVHMQIFSMIEHVSLSYKKFFWQRIFHAILSAIIFMMFFLLFVHEAI